MNKLLRLRAAYYARKVMRKDPFMSADAVQKLLEAAWMAGARSLDTWHVKQKRQPVASVLSVSAVESGTIKPGMTISAPSCPEIDGRRIV